MNRRSRLAPIDLPDFGMPSSMPLLEDGIYRARMGGFVERFSDRGYDHAVVYADREHSANLSYLTGFDPRFEEAMLVVGQGGAWLLVGNECVGMARAAPVDLEVILYQEFSLPGQPRDRSPSLEDILGQAGVSAGNRIGVVGWKALPDRSMLEIPSFLADTIRSVVGPGGSVESATDILIDASDGMRVINEVEQIVAFEYAACHTSQGVRSLLQGIEPGMTEQEAVALLGWNGSPLSCHLMLTAGERARLGLLSPGDRVIERGDPFTVAFGVWGALNCRAGFVVSDSSELDPSISDYVEKLVAPYFETVVEWYEALHIGQNGAALQEIVDRRLGDPFFGIFLNPGHQLHLDEWVNTPVGPGSEVELRSGMTLQADIIPATGTPYFTTNIEDGLVLADEDLRRDLSTGYPEVWSRMERRRDFMRDDLGIVVSDDVLPLSNIPAFLPPFVLDRDRAMTMV